METYTLAHFPSHVRAVHVAVFHNVTNAPAIRKRLISAATTAGPEGDALRAAVDFGFLEGNLLVSPEHLLTAIQTTILSALTDTTELKTRSHNIHSELLLTLSPNNNITDSIRRHGLSDSTTELVVVRIGAESEAAEQKEVWERIEAVVQGELGRVGDLEGTVDWARVDKVYKLAEMNALKLSEDELLDRKRGAVVSTVAIKSVT